MICPYCKKEMKNGKIRADKLPLNWYPLEEKKKFGIFSTQKVPILNGNDKVGIFDVLAYYCDDCDKIIIDISNKNI
ncbi:MAG: PF20097 family protein [Sarcina sp.]